MYVERRLRVLVGWSTPYSTVALVPPMSTMDVWCGITYNRPFTSLTTPDHPSSSALVRYVLYSQCLLRSVLVGVQMFGQLITDE